MLLELNVVLLGSVDWLVLLTGLLYGFRDVVGVVTGFSVCQNKMT